MIQNGTYLKVVDNSGAKDVCCIQVSKGYKKRYSHIGDVIVVSVKTLRKKRRLTAKIKKGDVTKGVIVRTRSITKSKQNEQIGFMNNCIVLLNKKNTLIGTRVFGAIPNMFKYSKYLRLASLCAGTVK